VVVTAVSASEDIRLLEGIIIRIQTDMQCTLHEPFSNKIAQSNLGTGRVAGTPTLAATHNRSTVFARWRKCATFPFSLPRVYLVGQRSAAV